MNFFIRQIIYLIVVFGLAFGYKILYYEEELVGKTLYLAIGAVMLISIVLNAIYTALLSLINKALEKKQKMSVADSDQWTDRQVEYGTDKDHDKDPYFDFREDHKREQLEK